MALFNKNNSTQFQISERQMLEMKYNNSRHNLLLVVIFTAINAILLLTNANSYFLFSAYIPYLLVDLGMFYCGRYPDEFYTEEFNGMQFLDGSFLVVMCVLAVIGIGLYLLCWFMSKNKKVGWLIAALVFMVIDTLALFFLLGVSLDMLIDYLFHAFVIYYLASGISTYYKLKNLPPEDAIVEVVDFEEAPVAQAEAASVEAPAIEEIAAENDEIQN